MLGDNVERLGWNDATLSTQKLSTYKSDLGTFLAVIKKRTRAYGAATFISRRSRSFGHAAIVIVAER